LQLLGDVQVNPRDDDEPAGSLAEFLSLGRERPGPVDIATGQVNQIERPALRSSEQALSA
jgi:hypothetical protein